MCDLICLPVFTVCAVVFCLTAAGISIMNLVTCVSSIKNNAEDRGRKPVGESVPAEGWIVLSIKYYDMLPLWKYD